MQATEKLTGYCPKCSIKITIDFWRKSVSRINNYPIINPFQSLRLSYKSLGFYIFVYEVVKKIFLYV
jgi:hypothetical protein